MWKETIMIVTITCPSCKTADAIRASINPRDLEGSSILYPDECPHCGKVVDADMIAELQYAAIQDIHDSMTESIYERVKERSIDKMISKHANHNKH